MKKIVPILLCVMFLAGCATQRANFKEMKVKQKPDLKQWDNFFVWGLAPPKKVTPASKACPEENISRVETEITFLNGVANAVTFGIYAPKTLKIYCES
jgi:PBP1b-binding outer membrane lipoprotein LpoB